MPHSANIGNMRDFHLSDIFKRLKTNHSRVIELHLPVCDAVYFDARPLSRATN